PLPCPWLSSGGNRLGLGRYRFFRSAVKDEFRFESGIYAVFFQAIDQWPALNHRRSPPSLYPAAVLFCRRVDLLAIASGTVSRNKARISCAASRPRAPKFQTTVP